MLHRLAAGALVVALALPATRLQEAAPAGPYICPPCGAECHFVEYPRAGGCPVCGMELVPLAKVPQVGVLVFPDVDLMSATMALGAFVSSNAVRAFTVADARDPVRSSDALEIVPQFELAQAPRLDVLAVPGGWGAHEDPLLVEWVGKAAQKARFVLAVGMGSVVLGRAGLLEGERVAAEERFAEHAKELAPKLVFDGSARLVRSGKFVTARDALGTLDGALEILAELVGEERAKRTAAGLGHTWTRAPSTAER